MTKVSTLDEFTHGIRSAPGSFQVIDEHGYERCS
jgi:hypothetical protein